MSGTKRSSSEKSVVCSMPGNRGWPASLSYRFCRYSCPSVPLTNLMCGTGRVHSAGSPRMVVSTAYDQNCRQTWNFSLTETALVMSTSPSAVLGDQLSSQCAEWPVPALLQASEAYSAGSHTTQRAARPPHRTRVVAVSPTSPDADAGPWLPDLLGPDFRRRDLPLGDDPDGEGPISAVLVRHEKAPARPEAVLLYVHGL